MDRVRIDTSDLAFPTLLFHLVSIFLPLPSILLCEEVEEEVFLH